MLENEIQMIDDNVASRLSFIFISGASFSFQSLNPADLPVLSYSLDPFILAHSQEVLFMDMHNPGVYTRIALDEFTNQIEDSFQQTLIIEEKPYHQALVLVDSVFSFQSIFNDTNLYLAHNNENLQLIYEKIQQIVHQEKQFYNEMYSFAQALLTNNLLQLPFNQSQFLEEDSHLFRSKRGLSDLFSNMLTGYSLPNVATVAQENYRKMNSNFKNSKLAEEHLRLTQNKLAQRYGKISQLQQHEIQLQFFLQVQHFLGMTHDHVMMHLDTIIETNEKPVTVKAVLELIRNLRFCDGFYCLVHPVFKIHNNTLFTTVQIQTLHLVQAVYVSCTLVGVSRTSKYSNQIAYVQDTSLVFKNTNLPRIPIDFLQDSSINAATRPINSNDLIGGIVFPVYKENLVALLCLEEKIITVDGAEMNCNPTTLHFISMPSSIIVDKTPILTTILSHYLAQHISVNMQSFSYNDKVYVPRKNLTTSIENRFETFFATANSLHYSIFATGTLAVILTFLVLCICCYFKLPGTFNSILCCFSPTCCLRQLADAKYKLMSRLSQAQPESDELADLHPRSSSSAAAVSGTSSSISVVNLTEYCPNAISSCCCKIDHRPCLKATHPHAQPVVIVNPDPST